DTGPPTSSILARWGEMPGSPTSPILARWGEMSAIPLSAVATIEFDEVSGSKCRAFALGKKLQHRDGDPHAAQVNGRQPHAVPHFHHDPFIHDPVQQLALAGKLRAHVHRAKLH